PFLLAEKQGVDYDTAPQGLPTVELLVPTVLDAAVRGRLPFADAVSYVTSAPARRFGLYPEGGTLKCGAAADIAIVARGTSFSPSPATFHTRASGCAVVFSDITLAARVEKTIVNGNVTYSTGRIVSDALGQFTAGHASLERV